MGMFDTIEVPCPACKELNYLQTKGGPRLLDVYPAYDVPLEASSDLVQAWYYAKNDDGLIPCEVCGEQLYVTVTQTVTRSTIVQLHKVLRSHKRKIAREKESIHE